MKQQTAKTIAIVLATLFTLASAHYFVHPIMQIFNMNRIWMYATDVWIFFMATGAFTIALAANKAINKIYK